MLAAAVTVIGGRTLEMWCQALDSRLDSAGIRRLVKRSTSTMTSRRACHMPEPTGLHKPYNVSPQL